MKKKDKDNFDFIKNKFEGDGITTPEKISESSILSALDENKDEKIIFKKHGALKGLIALAACFAVIVTCINTGLLTNRAENNEKVDTKQEAPVALGVKCLTSYAQAKEMIDKIPNENSDEYLGLFSYGKGNLKAETATTDIADSTQVENNFSSTYKQIDTVDEADIIKNNSEYIFYLNSTENKIEIYSADGQNPHLVSTIENLGNSSEKKNYECYIYDMFLYNNMLIVNALESMEEKGRWIERVSSYVYDVSNAQKPVKVDCFTVGGSYVSSRMIGDKLYLVSNYFANNCRKEEDYVPYYLDSSGKKCPMNPDDIFYFENPQENGYIVVTEIDLSTGAKQKTSKAVLGAGQDIYCNEDNIYTFSTFYEYTEKKNSNDEIIEYDEKSTTKIIKISLADGIKVTASGEVNGYIKDRYSADEKDSFLRIATTSRNKDNEEVNNLYVLDKDLKQIGCIEGFAKNESIKAVKFFGDTAYVITYEQTDPLFVIDLSKPENPEIKGSVKITGFSTMLVPVENDRLLGIGYSTDETINGEATDGLKLVLFDVSNPEKPKVLYSKSFEGYSSEVQFNPKALVINKEQGYYALPYNMYNESDERTGAMLFEIRENKIKIRNDFSSGNNYYVSRCAYIEDDFYILGDTLGIKAFSTK
ncbi:MAG: beta-propeller domain-containing protein [Eubacterium sp.]